MSIKGTPTASGKHTETHSLGQVVSRLAREISRLTPGPAAALRRGPLSGAGAAAFWQLMATHQPRTNDEAGWAALIQGIAILTPKGTDPNKKSAHEYRFPMGSALSKAEFSELRLARLSECSKGNAARPRRTPVPAAIQNRAQPLQSRNTGAVYSLCRRRNRSPYCPRLLPY